MELNSPQSRLAHIESFVPKTKAELEAIKPQIIGNPHLHVPPRPVEPVLLVSLPLSQKLFAIQKFISQFEYNYHEGNIFSDASYGRPVSAVQHTARAIINAALPIRCVEGVFLALYLTRAFNNVARIPLSFESEMAGKKFGHIVLAVRGGYQGSWGALGISRRKSLAGAPLVYPSLSALVQYFIKGYKKCFHTVRRVRLGVPVPHDMGSSEVLNWKAVTFEIKADDSIWQASIDTHVRSLDMPVARRSVSLSPQRRRPSPQREGRITV